MNKTTQLIIAGILFLLPAFEIGRWIYVAENAQTLGEAKSRYFAPYPEALKNNTVSTWMFLVCLAAAMVIFLRFWKKGMFFRILALLSGLLAFWMLFSLM